MIIIPAPFGPVRGYTASYGSVLSPERAPYMKKQLIARQMKVQNLVMGPKGRGARNHEELADWPSVVISTTKTTMN
jgi:hypothetical protein